MPGLRLRSAHDARIKCGVVGLDQMTDDSPAAILQRSGLDLRLLEFANKSTEQIAKSPRASQGKSFRPLSKER